MGKYRLSDIFAVEVEHWLNGLRQACAKQLGEDSQSDERDLLTGYPLGVAWSQGNPIAYRPNERERTLFRKR